MTKKELLAKKAKMRAEIKTLWVKFNDLMEQGLAKEDFRVQRVINHISGLEIQVDEIEEVLGYHYP